VLLKLLVHANTCEILQEFASIIGNQDESYVLLAAPAQQCIHCSVKQLPVDTLYNSIVLLYWHCVHTVSLLLLLPSVVQPLRVNATRTHVYADTRAHN
jgi:hypothetical protein